MRLTTALFVTKLITVMAANSQFAIAVHILTVLAKESEGNVKSDYIAASVKTNPVVIRRLLGDLNQAKLVVSQTGAHGGTRLAKCPREINLADIHKAISCGKTFALHRQTNDHCQIGKNIQCVLEKLQTEINDVVESRLAQFSLQDILQAVVAVGCSKEKVLS
jgi:Rrf2 family protein